jgi:hypothetical protein
MILIQFDGHETISPILARLFSFLVSGEYAYKLPDYVGERAGFAKSHGPKFYGSQCIT